MGTSSNNLLELQRVELSENGLNIRRENSAVTNSEIIMENHHERVTAQHLSTMAKETTTQETLTGLNKFHENLLSQEI